MGTGAHCRHGGLLADGARDDDKRQVEAGFLRQRKRCFGAEMGHRPVGDDDVPRLFQCSAHRFGRLHPLERGIEPAAAKLAQQQLGVVFPILDDQHPERPFHGNLPKAGARSLRVSQ
jgi:hypothetical protein